MFEFPKNFNYQKNDNRNDLGIFFFLEGSWLFIKLIADEVICQHIFFFTLSHFLDNNL